MREIAELLSIVNDNHDYYAELEAAREYVARSRAERRQKKIQAENNRLIKVCSSLAVITTAFFIVR